MASTTPAAQYLRMSTEHQRYSPEHQAAAIAAYAAERGYEIVRTYRDDGISGVSIRNRAGLKALLADVVGGEPGFETILVYDVSRWGRFQNPDQSAHYEFLCAEAGVKVAYCAEPFENDGSTGSTILKSLKRVMAAEYSRELSVKVSSAQRRLAAMGYWQGGPPGYGFRRQMVDEHGAPAGQLQAGQYKSIHAYRVVLVHGPREELDVVRRIFHAFVVGGASREAIARFLNEEGVPAEAGARWTYERVNAVLTNTKYVGTISSQRSSGGSLAPRVTHAPSDWLRVPGACPPIIDRKTFEAARVLIEASYRRLGREELLGLLLRLKAEYGRVTGKLIKKTPWMPSVKAYERCFGSLSAAYGACGLEVPFRLRQTRKWPDAAEAMRLLADLYVREGYLSFHLIASQAHMPHPLTYRRICGNLANAYAIVGYVPTSKRWGQASKVGEARLDAAQIRLRAALAGRAHAGAPASPDPAPAA